MTDHTLERPNSMVMLVLGAVLLGVGGILDSMFRLRMTRIGYKWALLQGGAFDYSRYHKVRVENGWAAWPVYVMWAAIVGGLVLLIAGFFSYFGTSPLREASPASALPLGTYGECNNLNTPTKNRTNPAIAVGTTKYA